MNLRLVSSLNTVGGRSLEICKQRDGLSGIVCERQPDRKVPSYCPLVSLQGITFYFGFVYRFKREVERSLCTSSLEAGESRVQTAVESNFSGHTQPPVH